MFFKACLRLWRHVLDEFDHDFTSCSLSLEWRLGLGESVPYLAVWSQLFQVAVRWSNPWIIPTNPSTDSPSNPDIKHVNRKSPTFSWLSHYNLHVQAVFHCDISCSKGKSIPTPPRHVLVQLLGFLHYRPGRVVSCGRLRSKHLETAEDVGGLKTGKPIFLGS